MQRVETYILTKEKAKADYKALVDICHRSKNLYNYVNYILRQCASNKLENIPEYRDLVQIKTKTVTKKNGETVEYVQNFISEFDLSKRLCQLKQSDYISLKAQCSQQVLKTIFKNYKSFYKANSEYFRNPSKFNGRPKLPNYKDKDGLNVTTYTNQSASISKGGFLKLSKDFVLRSVRTGLPSHGFQQVRIIPKLDYFQIEIVYNKQEGDYSRQAKLTNRYTNSAAIDIGVDRTRSPRSSLSRGDSSERE